MKYLCSRPLRQTIRAALMLLSSVVCFGMTCISNGLAQENNIGNDSHLASEERVVTRLSPVEEKQHRFYLNLGLTPGTGYSGQEGVSLFQEASLNFTSYTAWGFIGEVGASTGSSGFGGRLMVGYELMRSQGWHVFPFLVGTVRPPISSNPLALAPFNKPRVSVSAGLGTDYEIPGTRLMLGIRAGYNFTFIPEITGLDFTGNMRTYPAGTISAPDIQLRFGLRIGE